MNTSVLLWVLYMLSILEVRCGNQEEVKGAEAPENQSPEESHSGTNTLPQPSTKEPEYVTLDIADVNPNICKAIDSFIGGIPVRVHVINPNKRLRKIVNGKLDVWIARPKQYGVYFITFLKGLKAKMVLIRLKEPSGGYQTFRKYQKGTGCYIGAKGWCPSAKNYKKKINKLKLCSSKPYRATIDVSSDVEDERINVKSANQDLITTRCYTPNLGNIIGTIMDGDILVGKLMDEFTCFLCELFSFGNKSLLRVHTEKEYRLWMCWYEKVDGQWNRIEEDDFNEKFDHLLQSESVSKHIGSTKDQQAE